MVQFLDLPQSKSTGQKLMEGLGNAAQSIPDLIGSYQKSKQEREADTQIASILTKAAKTNPIFVPLAEIYSNPNIAHDHKVKAAEMIFSAQKASDPFKIGREQRLKQQGFQDRYQKAISALDRDIKESLGTRERPALQEKKKNLQKEFAANMKRMRQGLDPIFKYLEDEHLKGSEGEFGLESAEGIELTGGENKMRFDANNPEHRTKAQELYNEHGDKEKVREALSQEFSFE